jgi:hypothetical protein
MWGISPVRHVRFYVFDNFYRFDKACSIPGSPGLTANSSFYVQSMALGLPHTKGVPMTQASPLTVDGAL